MTLKVRFMRKILYHYLKKASEYDQEIPDLHTADQLTAP